MDLFIQIVCVLLLTGFVMYVAKRAKKVEKKELKPILSTEEQQIRADWRKSSSIFLLGNLGILLGSYFFLVYVNVEITSEMLIEDSARLISLVVATSILFYIAYDKFGTKWIAWYLFISAIRFTFATVKDLIDVYNLPDLTTFGIYYVQIIHLLSISLFVYFWTHCNRLYKLNKKINKREIQSGLIAATTV